MTKTLTPKQEDFLEALLGEARGNIRAAMDMAGYSKSTKTTEVLGPLKEEITEKDTQKCGGKKLGCMTCDLLNLPKEFYVWENNEKRRRKIKLDYPLNCKSEHVIFMYLCQNCEDPSSNFYVGQTVNACRQRANGHRACFNKEKHKKSALSAHTFADHKTHSDMKLNNYSLGIVKSTSAVNLDRLEDFYVDYTNAELSLNRYKVTS